MSRMPVLLLCAAAVTAACGDDETTSGGGGAGSGANGAGGDGASAGGPSGGGGGEPSTGGGGQAQGGSGTGGAGGAGGQGGGFVTVAASCFDDPPVGGAEPAAPKPYSGGACPTLVAGFNDIQSSGSGRSFRLAIPSNLQPDERLPVVFLWHWLGGSADDFYNQGEVQAAVDTQRFVAVIPVSKGDLLFQWPFETTEPQSRVEEEMTFFDDMLSCVSEQLNVIPSCVSSVGVSAGALFTDQLAGARADYLASFISLSGGVGGVIRPWGHPEHRLPGLVLWGGPTDTCVVINFETASHELEAGLGEDGSFFLECVHTCGHTEPPFEAPDGLSKYAGLWQFAFDHPFWLGAGESPYASGDFPPGMPDWCGVGPGSAVPPTGLTCTGGGC